MDTFFNTSDRWFLKEVLLYGGLLVALLWIGSTQLHLGPVEEDPAPGAGPDPQEVQPDTASSEDEVDADLPVLQQLIVPVEGVPPEALVDTYEDARGQGRQHDAIDIMAPHGTPVRAAAPGTIARLHESDAGGHSIYQLGPDSTYVFYYAHLERYDEGLEEEKTVEQGDIIGYVGASGNANPSAPHLHFAIWELEDPDWIWEGPMINPYPLLSPDE